MNQLGQRFQANHPAAPRTGGPAGMVQGGNVQGLLPLRDSRIPALLLPTRLEARFGTGPHGPELRLRFYPDQIAVDTHEPALTAEEQTAGSAYWGVIGNADTDATENQKAAWRTLAAQFGPQRAAWIRHATAPGAPSTTSRPSPWTRAPQAAALPKYWVVATYVNGKETRRVALPPIQDKPLNVGLTPHPDQSPANDGTPPTEIDAGMRWMVDFDEAVTKGMGIRIPISAAERASGFDRVVVVGLCTPVPGTDGVDLLTALLDAHHYANGDGLALLQRGMAAHNSPDAPCAYSRRDPGYERSYTVECGAPLATSPTCDAQVALRLLGIPPERQTFDHVQGADSQQLQHAQDMVVALWPATLGYFLSTMMADVFSADAVEAARVYVRDNVRGGGHLPLLGADWIPYGILPATSLALWNPPDASAAERQLVAFLRRALPLWQQMAASSPRIGASTNPDADLTAVLGMEATSLGYRGRHVLGEQFISGTLGLSGMNSAGQSFWWKEQERGGRQTLASLGYAAWNPRLLATVSRPDSFPLSLPSVQAGPLSWTTPLASDCPLANGGTGNYLQWLASTDPMTIQQTLQRCAYPSGADLPPLLFLVLGQSVVLAASEAAVGALVAAGLQQRGDFREAEIVSRSGPSPTLTPVMALSRTVPGLTAPQQPLSEYLATTHPTAGVFARYGEVQASLGQLATLPTAELDRLFAETLDTFSHRLDAWVTSLAMALLTRQRQVTSASPQKGQSATTPAGLHVGAYSWVQNLRPAAPTGAVTGTEPGAVGQMDAAFAQMVGAARAQPAGAVQQPPADNGGFLHAPSLPQAEAAAVLRSGYLTHRQSSNGQLLAVDLSSERVQTALGLIAGVREGQALGALLGERFERALHAAKLDAYIQPFRNAYPLVANKLVRPGDGDSGSQPPADAVAASMVVDGLALVRTWQQGQLSASATSWGVGLPPAGMDRDMVITLLNQLVDVLDALGDLSLADGVYQLVRGAHGRAAGLLDALSRGERAPDPQVTATLRQGRDVTHRLMVLLSGDAVPAAAWADVPANPRGRAEPHLDAWLSTLLPDPANARCRVAFAAQGDAASPASSPAAAPSAVVTVADLGIGPLELLAALEAAGDVPGSELDARVRYQAHAHAPAGVTRLTDVQVIYDRDPVWDTSVLSFPELLTAVHAYSQLIGGGRPLTPEDLLEPGQQQAGAQGSSPPPSGAGDDIVTRATTAIAGLSSAADALDAAVLALQNASPATVGQADGVRNALLVASHYGVAGAIPATVSGATTDVASALVTQGQAVSAELHRRLSIAQLALGGSASPSSPAQALAALQAVFGGPFVALPALPASPAVSQGDPFAKSSTLIPGNDRQHVLAAWLQQLVAVRPAVSRADMAITLAQVVTQRATAPWLLGQLPVESERWLGLPLSAAPTPAVHTPPQGRVSLAALVPWPYDPAQALRGLLIDEWIERIPDPMQTTGVVFDYAAPKARAPQALLLAVCPDAAPAWTDDHLFAIVNETLDLAKIRTVQPDSLGALQQFLPALFFAFNPDGDTASVPLVRVEQNQGV